MITLHVDGKSIEAKENELLIQVLLENGIDIPYFCYHEALGADGNCRMCMVEIEGQKRPQIACDTFAKDGMVISTKSDNIKEIRKNILELELINHPIDCPICDQAGECKLQDFYMDYGLYDSNIKPSQKTHHQKHIDLGSNVVLDQERCVLCARCVRFTSHVTKTNELSIIGRGDNARVATMPNRELNNPYAMNVIDLCPVGALTSKDFRFTQRIWFMTSTESICHGCAKACAIYIDHNREKYKDEKIYRFRPRVNNEINGHFICTHERLFF
jgi:NADH-quinone oxidoreductase subunit G